MFDDEPRGRLDSIGRRAAAFAAGVGRCASVTARSLASMPACALSGRRRRAFAQQLYATGVKSLPVITVVGFFTGMILGLQVGLALARFNQENLLGAAVMITLMREMAPFVTGLCLSACVGSAMAAELGTMTVNDEIAALEIMSVPPVKYLAAPRICSLAVMAPLLSFYACVLGVVGGGFVGAMQLNVDFRQYISSAIAMAEVKDLAVGLLKAALFGVIIGGVSCHQGFSAELGALGVGRAVQKSVIVSFLLILVAGYMVTRLAY